MANMKREISSNLGVTLTILLLCVQLLNFTTQAIWV